MLYGYGRVSTTEQDLSIQHAALTRAGCTVIRSEKITGTSTEGREELATSFQFMCVDNTLVVTRIDRLARSLRDLQNAKPVVAIDRNRWSPSTGTGGRLQSKRLVVFNRNSWSPSAGVRRT